jgi:hypothetical protein
MVVRTLPIFILFIVAGCSSPSATPSGTGGTETPGVAKQSESTTLSYPELYTSANLPQYANAKLTDTGRQTSSLRDGLRLSLETDDDVQTVAKFFETEMAKLGWTVPEKKFRSDQVDVTRCTKGEVYFQVTTTKMPDKTTILINYAQN